MSVPAVVLDGDAWGLELGPLTQWEWGRGQPPFHISVLACQSTSSVHGFTGAHCNPQKAAWLCDNLHLADALLTGLRGPRPPPDIHAPVQSPPILGTASLCHPYRGHSEA